ncbi:kinase-like protein [Cucurbitaria berberidis CBS 394.84]|uniref:Kinase-like protein n=1 Tax=Cucurbitaria berberidis CBS 394.84 TaxID=1168544 RepID=A0A9P4GRL1_9PLEO|nr:kinase-like protein [Cucurbitaria berberidis CBS 394.84]KAF1851293.1 kinase-like protein [Cucurbitaria berberidis CBS 394.84]
MSATTRAVGQSGRRYLVERILQDKHMPHGLGRVYLALSDNQKYVLKKLSATRYAYLEPLYDDVRSSPYVRVAADAIPDESMFAYTYFRGHLLGFTDKDVPLSITKQILKDALRGIAALHHKDIVHTDIKPDNIMINWTEKNDGTIIIDRVQVADLEDSAYVPPDCDIIGRQVGNWMWRSPEAHASGAVQKPTDIFSFGIVCIYAITKHIIFAVTDEELNEGEEKLAVVLERQVSYFGDIEGMTGLLEHLKDNPWVGLYTLILQAFGKENRPMQPIERWEMLEPDFKDLVKRMTSMDPGRRLTAYEALAHPWFADVP